MSGFIQRVFFLKIFIVLINPGGWKPIRPKASVLNSSIQALLICVINHDWVKIANVLLTTTPPSGEFGCLFSCETWSRCLQQNKYLLCSNWNTALRALSTKLWTLIIYRFSHLHCDEFLHPRPTVWIRPLLSQAEEQGAGRALSPVNKVQYSWRNKGK